MADRGWPHLGLMIATLWASQSRWLIFAATISTLSTAYLASNPLFWANVPPAVGVVLFSVPFSALVDVLRPPAVLFLGSSEFSQELYVGENKLILRSHLDS